MKTHQSRSSTIVLLALAAFALAIVLIGAPKATNITNASSAGAPGIDILGLTRNARELPVEQFDAY